MTEPSAADVLLSTVRTYKRRSGRVTASQQQALDVDSTHFDLADCSWTDIQRRAGDAEIVVDIGFGFGESVLHYAQAQPARFIVGLEVHLPGVGALCRDAATAGLSNIGVLNVDARQWLADVVPDAALSGVRLFFPDPWPKKRHHKRRFIRRPVLDLLASRCAAGAFLHIATDISDYADDAQAELAQSPFWHLQAGADHRQHRPVTKFERRANVAQRQVFDILAYRA